MLFNEIHIFSPFFLFSLKHLPLKYSFHLKVLFPYIPLPHSLLFFSTFRIVSSQSSLRSSLFLPFDLNTGVLFSPWVILLSPMSSNSYDRTPHTEQTQTTLQGQNADLSSHCPPLPPPFTARNYWAPCLSHSGLLTAPQMCLLIPVSGPLSLLFS